MDPISTAITAALAAGFTQSTVVEAYNGIKFLIKTKFGNNNDIISAIDRLEQRPHSNARQMELQEQVEENHLDKNIDIVEVAEKLIKEMKASGDEKHVMHAKGKGIAQANHGSTANVTLFVKDN